MSGLSACPVEQCAVLVTAVLQLQLRGYFCSRVQGCCCTSPKSEACLSPADCLGCFRVNAMAAPPLTLYGQVLPQEAKDDDSTVTAAE